MNDDNELDPVARLRAADPAAGVEPSAGFADAVVARATAEVTADAAADAASDDATAAPVTDLDTARARRRPRWIAVAAVAASIAVVGAAGYGIGTSTAGSSNLAGGAAAPIALQGADGAREDGAADGSGSAATERLAAGSSADMSYGYGYGRNSFSASGLSSTDGSAAAYAFDARSASNAATVAALAAAFGLDGTPQLANGSWTVGSTDGTGPSLTVGLDGTLGFSYYDPAKDPWQQCTKATEAPETCQPTGAVPSEAAATDAMRALIAAAGRDPGAFEYTTQTYEGSVSRTAQAWPVVDGQRIDQAWSLELVEGGLYNASGALAGLVALGDYAVVSEQEAFERLSDPRFGTQQVVMPFAVREGAAASADAPVEWVPPTEPPATPTAGSRLAWAVNDVKIVSARLGLASQWQPDGGVLVVPAYEFTDANGGTWSVIAVADSMLDFASN